MAENFEQVPNLEMWRPKDSFKDPLNLVVFDGMLARLKIVEVKKRQDDDDIYAVGNGFPYELVTPTAVRERSNILRSYRVQQAFNPEKEVAPDGIEEEARARELQLVIARTAIKVGIRAEDVDDFDRSFHDLVESFRDVKLAIYSKEDLHEASDVYREDLIQAYIKASQLYKTITGGQARTLSTMIDRAIILGADSQGKSGSSWRTTAGIDFVQKFTSKKKTSKKSAQTKPKNAKTEATGGGSTQEKKVKPKPPSNEELFLTRLRLPRTPRDTDKRRSWLHEQYVDKGVEFPAETAERKTDIVKLGLRAYLETYDGVYSPSKSLAANVANYLLPVAKERIFKRLLTIGNLFAAKINVHNEYDSQLPQVRLPGIKGDTESILASFQILRGKLNGRYDIEEVYESEKAKQIGDLLEAFIASTDFNYDFSHAPRFSLGTKRRVKQ